MDEGGRETALGGTLSSCCTHYSNPFLSGRSKMVLQLDIGLTFAAHLLHHMHHSASSSAADSFGLSLAPLPVLSQVSPQVSSCFNDSSTAIKQNSTQIRGTAGALGGMKGGRIHLCSTWNVFANIPDLQPNAF